MSGIGGVGFMTIWSAKEGRAWTIDYGPISARKLDPMNYKIVGPGPANPFAWPDILEQRNEVGYHSIAVPGQVAGVAKALERFGTMKWQDVMAPAVALAERGMELDWYMQVMIANGAQHLAKFPASQRRLPARRGPRADARLAGQRALPQARQSRRDLPAAGRRADRANSTRAAWRATSPPTCRPAARRSPTTISNPTRRASSSRCRSSMAAPPSTSRAA